ncbi:hypothetical protein RRF57_006292 [Xylaria bambusicola]|uniref:Uncharacterized protein n=1 Tax=Xylaria bambusicola TaxID=326684 RepID=A0AAN7Z6P5_9PEZI
MTIRSLDLGLESLDTDKLISHASLRLSDNVRRLDPSGPVLICETPATRFDGAFLLAFGAING